jgi:drug/metabolite transporter (DMT)-like permease
MQNTSSRQGHVFAALTVALWCGFVVVSRLGGSSVLTPFDVVALRFAPAAIILLPLWLWRRKPARIFTPQLLCLAAVGGVAYSLLVYTGFRYAPAAHAGILLPGLLPFEIALFSWWLLDERPDAARWMGLVLIGGGILLLAAESFGSAGRYWLGDMLVAASSVCWSLYTVLARRWRVGAWDATVGGVLLTALFYLPIHGLFLPSHLTQASAVVVLTQAIYQGVLAVVIAMLLYMRAVALLGPGRMGALMAIIPAGSGLLAVPLLDEPLTPALVLGLALVSAGAYVGSQQRISFNWRVHAVRQHQDHP